MTASFLLFQLIGGAAAILCFWSFDSLVRELFLNHHDRWQALGRPPGFFWAPHWKVSRGGTGRTRELAERIWFAKPKWIRNDPRLLQLWWRMTLALLLLAVAVLGLVFHELLPF